VDTRQHPEAAAAGSSRPQKRIRLPVHPDKDLVIDFVWETLRGNTSLTNFTATLLPDGPHLTAAQQKNLPDLNEFKTNGRRTASPHEEELIRACATCNAHHGTYEESSPDNPIDLTHDEDNSFDNPIDLSGYAKHDTHTDNPVDCYLCTDSWKANDKEDRGSDPLPNLATWAKNQHENGLISHLQEEGLRRADQLSAFYTTKQPWSHYGTEDTEDGAELARRANAAEKESGLWK